MSKLDVCLARSGKAFDAAEQQELIALAMQIAQDSGQPDNVAQAERLAVQQLLSDTEADRNAILEQVGAKLGAPRSDLQFSERAETTPLERDAKPNELGLTSKLEDTARKIKVQGFESSKRNPEGRALGTDIMTALEKQITRKHEREEIEATGLRDYLTLDPRARFTRDHVVDFLQGNAITVTEVVGKSDPDDMERDPDSVNAADTINWIGEERIDPDESYVDSLADERMDEWRANPSDYAWMDDPVWEYYESNPDEALNILEDETDAETLADLFGAEIDPETGGLLDSNLSEVMDAIREMVDEGQLPDGDPQTFELAQTLARALREGAEDAVYEVAKEDAYEVAGENSEFRVTGMIEDMYVEATGRDGQGWIITTEDGSTLTEWHGSLDEATVRAVEDMRDRGLIAREAGGETSRWSASKWNAEVPAENYREYKLHLPQVPGNFEHSTHYPGEENIVTFLRVSDLDMANATDSPGEGTMFTIGEQQSDWHQHGRRHGYLKDSSYAGRTEEYGRRSAKATEARQAFAKAVKTLNAAWSVGEGAIKDSTLMYVFGKQLELDRENQKKANITQLRRDRQLDMFRPEPKQRQPDPAFEAWREQAASLNLTTEFNAAYKAYKDLDKAGSYVDSTDAAVPDAPFKAESWLRLGLKRALLEAASGGYAYLGWADGDNLSSVWSDQYEELYLRQYDNEMPKLIEELTGVKPDKVTFPTKNRKNRDLKVNGYGYWYIPITPELQEKLGSDPMWLFRARPTDEDGAVVSRPEHTRREGEKRLRKDATLAEALDSGKLRVVGQGELDALVAEDASWEEIRGNGRLVGVYNRSTKTAVLLADNMSSPADFVPTAYHELLHEAQDYAEATGDQRLGLLLGDQRDKLVARLEKLEKWGSAREQELLTEARDLFEQSSSSEALDANLRSNEYLAYVAQVVKQSREAPRSLKQWLQDFMSAVLSGARKIMGLSGDVDTMSLNEFVRFVDYAVGLRAEDRNTGDFSSDNPSIMASENPDADPVQVSWESIPGATANHLPEMANATDAQLAEYHSAIESALAEGGVDTIAEQFGLRDVGHFQAVGYFDGKSSPGTQQELSVSLSSTDVALQEGGRYKLKSDIEKRINLYASTYGVVLKQDAVGWHAPVPKSGSITPVQHRNAVHVELGRAATKAEVVALAQEMARLSGKQDYNPIATNAGLRLINFGFLDVDNVQFHQWAETAIANTFSDATITARKFAVVEGYVSNDWRENPNGEGYLGGDARRPSGDARRIHRLAVQFEPAIRAVEERFASQYGWTANRSLNDAYVYSPGSLGRSGSAGRAARVEAGAGNAGVGDAGQGVPRPVSLRGRPAPGASTVVGVHYGNADTDTLRGDRYGTGIKGEEKTRIEQSGDPRLSRRVYFYLRDEGLHLTPWPEAGLGTHVYQQSFNNVIDPASPIGVELRREAIQQVGEGASLEQTQNAFESLLIDRGYDGYVNRTQRAIVILDADVPVTKLGMSTDLPKNPGLMFSEKPNPQAVEEGNKWTEQVRTAESDAGRQTLMSQAPSTAAVTIENDLNLMERVVATAPGLLWMTGRRQLAEIAPPNMTAVQDYLRDAEQMDADRNALLSAAGELQAKWHHWARNNKEAAQKQFDLMHETTVIGYDPAEPYTPLITEPDYFREKKRLNDRVRNAKDADETARARQALKDLDTTLEDERARKKAKPAIDLKWRALTKEGKALFVEVRDSYDTQSRRLYAELMKRIDRTEMSDNVRQAMRDKLRVSFESSRVRGPYFPLARFGDHWVVARDKKTGVMVDYQHFDWEWSARRHMIEEEKKGYAVRKGAKSEDGGSWGDVDPAFAETVAGLIANHEGIERKDRMELADAVWQLYLQTLPEMSVRKSFIHRKKTSGWNEDALRAYAHQALHAAHHVTKVRHGDKLAAHLTRAAGQAKELRDSAYADRLVESLRSANDWAMNPTNAAWAQALTSIGFIGYLGLTPAAAAVNMVQTPAVAYPILGAHFGYDAAAAALWKATSEFGGVVGKNVKNRADLKQLILDQTEKTHYDSVLSGDEKAAYDELVRRGRFDKTLSHDIAGVAQEGMDRNLRVQRVMDVVSSMFHNAEVYNREVTGMAAYRLARKRGRGHAAAIDLADKIVNDAHFDYSNSARVRIARPPVAKVVTQFKQYALNMSWRLLRDAYVSLGGGAVDAETRRIVRRQATGMWLMAGFFAGASGIPIYSAIAGMANLLHDLTDEDDKEWDFEIEVRTGLAELVGPDMAEVIWEGPITALSGASISERVSPDIWRMWIQDNDQGYTGRDQLAHFFLQMAGPVVGGTGGMMLEGVEQMRQGEWGRGLEQMTPKFLRDALKAARFADEGVTNLRGDPILARDELSTTQLVYQALGFVPSELQKQYGLNRARKQRERNLSNKKSALYSRAWRQIQSGNGLGEKLIADFERFNRTNPELAISSADLRASIEGRFKASERSTSGINIQNEALRERLLREINW